MSEQETPYVPGSYEKDPRPRDYYVETGEGIKHYDDLTPVQRQKEIKKQRDNAKEARGKLDEIYDSTNSTAPVAGLRETVDQSEDRLRVLEADVPSSEDIASARHALGLDRLSDPRNAADGIDPETVDPEEDPENYDPST